MSRIASNSGDHHRVCDRAFKHLLNSAECTRTQTTAHRRCFCKGASLPTIHTGYSTDTSIQTAVRQIPTKLPSLQPWLYNAGQHARRRTPTSARLQVRAAVSRICPGRGSDSRKRVLERPPSSAAGSFTGPGGHSPPHGSPVRRRGPSSVSGGSTRPGVAFVPPGTSARHHGRQTLITQKARVNLDGTIMRQNDSRKLSPRSKRINAVDLDERNVHKVLSHPSARFHAEGGIYCCALCATAARG